ncbi:ABC transporter substrate-binding protein [Amnibacterium kyonggiense]|uniref:Carbohydrate ABC transporter substrate-binding protein (CUT1 family) n=1 Tax=Amnibacterium kyonggiense TaxID=595671 RepID=A0A4R7FRB4_9MICO|nr:extracellular solute-binding protein [Amnibacterium kyonggiense]TDS80347.1 carbohydrate ABC transporter substrate-binding protein (CUT1 family) [Amnibacterium kyonggiense]
MRTPVSRRVGAAAIAAALLVGVSACSSTAGSPSGDSGGKGTVTFFSWDALATMKPLVAEFEKENPGIKVDMSYAPPVDEYVNTLQKRLLARNAADVFILGNHKEQIGGGYVKDLTGTTAAKVQSPFGTKMNTYNGKVYGISTATWGGGFLVNETLAAKAGITSAPQTWSELLTDLKKFKAAGITGLQEAGDGTTTTIMGLIGRADATSGGNMDANIYNGKTTFAASWTKPLETWSQLYTSGLVNKSAAGLTGPQIVTEFDQQKVAMITTGAWQVAPSRKALPSGTKLNFWPIPSEDGAPYWAGAASPPYAINSKAKNPVGAQKFVNFLASEKGVSMYAAETGSIMTTSNYKQDLDPALQTMYKDVVAGNVWCTWQAWPGTNSAPLDQTLIANMQKVQLGQETGAQMAKALDTEWNSVK